MCASVRDRSFRRANPVRRLPGGPDLYEHEIENFVWSNPEELLGESVMPVARQPNLASGGRPDVLALTEDARVVVVEIKREVDRRQLAQCLEYAGWARSTSLDELSRLYHRGDGEFFDWLDSPELHIRRSSIVDLGSSWWHATFTGAPSRHSNS
jgi:hypothetical protein